MRIDSNARRGVAAFAGIVLAAAIAGCANFPAAEKPVFAQPFAPIDAFAQKDAMGRGVAVLSEDPGWSDPAKARFTPRHFKLIHDAGFNTVRMVLTSFNHMDASLTLDPKWLARLDTMVEAALAQNLTVILDEHDYEICGKDPVICKTKLDAFWSQVGPRYKDAPNKLVFEMLNEPHGAMTSEMWNAQLRETLGVIRASNPARNVIVGPTNWNGIEDLSKLDLPDDPHLIVTVHYYHPFHFTHQGTTWNGPEIQALHDIHWGSDADYALLDQELDGVKAWGDAHHRPIFLGEFGAYETGTLPDRVKWTNAVARAAEAHGFSWAYWQFDKDFIVYNINEDHWVEPILHALIPPSDKVSGAAH